METKKLELPRGKDVSQEKKRGWNGGKVLVGGKICTSLIVLQGVLGFCPGVFCSFSLLPMEILSLSIW